MRSIMLEGNEFNMLQSSQTIINNKIIMNSKSPSFRVGVLNMTICFDRQKHSNKIRKQIQSKHVKTHPVPVFIPRYGQPRQHNTSVEKNEEQLSPYQRYHKSQKESIRYFREHFESTQKQKKIQGLSPNNNKTIQLQFNQSFIQQDNAVAGHKEAKDNHLKLVYTKRHLRNTIDLQNQNKNEPFCINFYGNPEQSLKNIFTVRSIKTSMRSNRKISNREENLIVKVPKTKQERRGLKKNVQDTSLIEKKIRPWSPTTNYFNKETVFQSDILVPLQPQQSNLQ